MSVAALEREAIGALVIGAIAPVWQPLIFLSFGLTMTAFILAIMSIVRGRALQGALLIAACPFALFFSFVVMNIALTPGTWPEKLERIKQEQEQRDAQPTPSRQETRDEVLKKHREVLRKAHVEPNQK